MKEKETVNRLDYLIRKFELPEEQDSKLRNIVKDAFYVGNDYFLENLGSEYLKPPFWKFWKPSVVRNVHGWDNKELEKELNNYVNTGNATGDLTKRLDYLLVLDKPPTEHERKFRKVSASAACLSIILVTENVIPECEWVGDINLLTLETWHTNEIDYQLLNKYFDRLKKKQPI